MKRESIIIITMFIIIGIHTGVVFIILLYLLLPLLLTLFVIMFNVIIKKIIYYHHHDYLITITVITKYITPLFVRRMCEQ